MVMRGCSRSRITPAVFSHSRARPDGLEARAQEVPARDGSRALGVRERDAALRASGTWQG